MNTTQFEQALKSFFSDAGIAAPEIFQSSVNPGEKPSQDVVNDHNHTVTSRIEGWYWFDGIMTPGDAWGYSWSHVRKDGVGRFAIHEIAYKGEPDLEDVEATLIRELFGPGVDREFVRILRKGLDAVAPWVLENFRFREVKPLFGETFRIEACRNNGRGAKFLPVLNYGPLARVHSLYGDEFLNWAREQVIVAP